MTLFARAYVSFLQLSDQSAHNKHNAWHQLEHLPENRLLPGVAWGDRWVRDPACVASSEGADGALGATDYFTFYLLRSPHAPAVESFFGLAAQVLQTGDRPEHAWFGTHTAGEFVPIRGYLGSGVRTTPEALPLRPGRGVYVTVRDVPGGGDVNAVFRHVDQVTVPAAIEVEGVDGAWTLVDAASYTPFPPDGPTRRVTVYYCAADPIDAAAGISAAEQELTARFPDSPLLFASPFHTITPYQWDWFDAAPAG